MTHSSSARIARWLTALSILAACAVSPSQTPAQPQTVRVAIVGLAHDHVMGFLAQLPQHHEVELVGIAEADSKLIDKYKEKFHLADTLFFKSEANMIEVRHPQAVLVYTSIAEHRNAIGIAAQYGVSSMVEKPLTISLEDALAIRKIARYHKVHVLVNYETTWYASNRAAFDAVRDGKTGPIRRVVVHDGHEGPREIGVSPEFLNWLTDPAQNGAGALYDFGCYGVDLMTWLMHGETPESVMAVLNHDKPDIYPKVDDDSTIVLKYPRAHRHRALASRERTVVSWIPGGRAQRQNQGPGRPERARYQRDRHADPGCGAGVGEDGQSGAVDESLRIILP